MLICPLFAKDTLQGMIAVTTLSPLPIELTNTIETLAAQVALALDRETLTETFHARRSEARFRTLVQSASDVILIARPDTTIMYQTPSAKSVLGYEPGSLEGERLTTLLHPDDVEQALAVHAAVTLRPGAPHTAQWRIRHQLGSWSHFDVVVNNLLDDVTVQGIVLTMHDVSERKGLEDELKHQAFHDALSGLANRALFSDRLEHASARAARSLSSLAVLFLDLDDFKVVNDSHGHAAGDEILIEVARRLVGALRVGDTAARFGGDEFAILLEEITGTDEAVQLAKRILDELNAPTLIGGRVVQMHASIGIALSVAGGEAPADLLQAADVAMYTAKAQGKGRVEVYHPALQEAITERLAQSAELRRALDERQFVVYYQPIVTLEDGKTVGFEALVRWRHPRRGLLLPEDFIALAETTGLIIPLGRWVLKEACRQARQWQIDYPRAGRLRMSVNISVRHFQYDGLVDDVSDALQAVGLDGENLVLEITESVLVQEADAVVERMLALKLLGVRFAIDDFGTGYSSLSYLQRFPISILKVDKAFVDGVGESPEGGALAETIIQLGHTLHLETVAEGIEQPRQAHVLRDLGCQFGQGFYFDRALPAREIEDLISRQSSSDLLPLAATLRSIPA